jgi:putative endonuclease
MGFQKNQNNNFKKDQGRQSWLKGVYAENIAACFLRLKGYKILKRRLKTPVGEIDILCKKGQTLVVVEVKYRSTFSQAIHSVSIRQIKRLERTVQWIVIPKYSMMKIRFDVLCIVPYKVPKHIKNVWSQKNY